MGVEDPGGYLDNKTTNKNRVKTIVDAAIDEGIYVIIDWHSHHAEDNTNEAALFFQEMANLYGEYDNVIYEIYNEPLDISWSTIIKPYAISIIAAIRSIDPDNLIVVGTPEWSQRVDLAAADPITGYSNIAYTLHFYSIHHQQWLRDRASAALESGIALFVTEWGSIGYSLVDSEANEWMAWCFTNKISHCNWAVNDKEEEWSILIPGASTTAGWSDDDLTKAGKLARNIIRNWPE
jgi:aryl-phospho-beta-D-glucosidase BglC (GH1 family)